MTDTEINIAIAEILGWAVFVGWDGHWPQRKHYSVPGCKTVMHGVPPGKKQEDYIHYVGAQDNLEPVPNYAGCLNAMNEVETAFITPVLEKKWITALTLTVHGNSPRKRTSNKMVRASARQRAEAFLRTIGKWKEDA